MDDEAGKQRSVWTEDTERQRQKDIFKRAARCCKRMDVLRGEPTDDDPSVCVGRRGTDGKDEAV